MRGRLIGSTDQEVKRHEFVVAVMKAVAEHGYKDVTVATICEAAGFHLIGHYFSGEDALLLHAVGKVAKDFEQAARAAAEAAATDPLDCLHAMVSARFRVPVFTPERVLVWVALASTSHWLVLSTTEARPTPAQAMEPLPIRTFEKRMQATTLSPMPPTGHCTVKTGECVLRRVGRVWQPRLSSGAAR